MGTIKSTLTTGSRNRTRAQQKGLDIWFNRQVTKFEQTRFGWMAIYITIQSCLGSIAVAYILQNHASDLMLAICAMLTMAANAIFIAQAPGKWCLAIFYLCLIVNSALIFLNI
jgi:hypothetical protein